MYRKSAELIQKIKSAVNILDVVGEHVVLRKSGANAVGLCPFHSERSPSFSVSESKQLYHCYGCKKGGDLVSFVMEIMGVSFAEALEELADRAKIPASERLGHRGVQDGEKESEARKKQNLAFKLNRFAATYFHRNLETNAQAKRYLRGRGIHQNWAERFYVGVALDSWDALAKHLVLAKAPLPIGVELGLIRPSKRNDLKDLPGAPGYFDLFRNRAIFPILNLRGKVAGFGGRALGDETPKYLNSPESIVFHKSRLIFGLYQAQKFVRELDQVILVEGYFDVLAMHCAGFQNVVSTCGTALTPDHLKILSRFASQIVVLFDGDSAGVAATERVMETALESGHVLFGAKIPAGLDPDEILLKAESGELSQDGVEQMKAILAAARPILDERIQEEIEGSKGSAEARTQAVKKVMGWLAKFSDPVGREIRIQALEKGTGVSRVLFGGGPKVPLPKGGPIPVPRSKKTAQVGKPLGGGDLALLSGLVSGGDFISYFIGLGECLPRDTSSTAGLELLADAETMQNWIKEVLTDSEKLEQLKANPSDLLRPEELDPALRMALSECLVAEQGISLTDFQRLLMGRVGKRWLAFSRRIKGAIRQAEGEGNRELQDDLLKEYLDVQRKMKEFSNFYDEA
ncbi:MAG: DNA primase [Bdellovibrio sp.]|nr:DNA primase [Bdellovibrio sp.]